MSDQSVMSTTTVPVTPPKFLLKCSLREHFSSEQQITGINVLSFLPRLIRDIPELVILSRGNRAIANLELHQRVRMRPRRQNLTSTS